MEPSPTFGPVGYVPLMYIPIVTHRGPNDM